MAFTIMGISFISKWNEDFTNLINGFIARICTFVRHSECSEESPMACIIYVGNGVLDIPLISNTRPCVQFHNIKKDTP